MSKVLYLIGSLRNERIPELAKTIRTSATDIEVFDDWYAAGPEADDCWKSYEQERGRTYQEALEGHAARNVFNFDRRHLDRATHALLVLPAGKSGHMEIMYATYGVKAKTAILLDPEDVRWDVMYQFVPTILNNDEEILPWLNSPEQNTTAEKSDLNSYQLVRSEGWQKYSGLVPGSMRRITGVAELNTPGSLVPQCDTSRRLMTAKTSTRKAR